MVHIAGELKINANIVLKVKFSNLISNSENELNMQKVTMIPIHINGPIKKSKDVKTKTKREKRRIGSPEIIVVTECRERRKSTLQVEITENYKSSKVVLMNIWTCGEWKKYIYDFEPLPRRGLLLRFEEGVDSEVREALKEFAKWLRYGYVFPIRVPVYVKAAERIKAKDGDLVCGTFFWPGEYGAEPYVRIATGDYFDLKSERGRDNALASILGSLIHELTHYFQYINKYETTPRGEEIQACYYQKLILDEYANTRDHP